VQSQNEYPVLSILMDIYYNDLKKIILNKFFLTILDWILYYQPIYAIQNNHQPISFLKLA